MRSLRCLIALSCAVLGSQKIGAQHGPALSPKEQAVFEQIGKLRSVPDADRGRVTRHLALDIRKLSPTDHRVLLAHMLANLST